MPRCAVRYNRSVAGPRHPIRERFEAARRREAFFSFLAGAGIGIIAVDTWVSPMLGVLGGFTIGGLAYATVYGYETLMWRRHHG